MRQPRAINLLSVYEYVDYLLKDNTSINSTGCIIYTSNHLKSRKGYLEFKHNYKNYRANRVILTRHIGPPPNESYECHHKCKNRSCMNPEHMEWLTQIEHGKTKIKEFCKRGHKLDINGRNSKIKSRGTCLECYKLRSRGIKLV